MPHLWLVMRLLLHFIFLSLFSGSALAQSKGSSRVAVGAYKDDSLSAKMLHLGLSSEFVLAGEGNDYISMLDASYRQQHLEKSDGENARHLDLQGGGSLESKEYGLQWVQALGVQQNVQLLYNIGNVGQANSRSIGAGYQRWLIMDRIRGGVVVKKNDSKQVVSDYTDVDGKRVVTPDKIDGDNYQGNLMAYLTSESLALLDYSYTTRTDRPAAWSSTVQVRQYVTGTNAALHMSLSHYENVGTIQPITTYGSVVANAASTEWHQKFLQQYVWMTGYRVYLENENPRSDAVEEKKVGSDYVYTTLRYRFAKSWTYRSSELSASFGHYFNNAGLKGNMASIGVDVMLP